MIAGIKTPPARRLPQLRETLAGVAANGLGLLRPGEWTTPAG